MQLRDFHKYNAAILIVFLFIHLATHVSGIFGIATYNAVQNFFRTVYRNPAVEPVLIASISLQLLVGAALLLRSLRRGPPDSRRAKLQVISGGFFFVFMAQHLFSLGMARLYFHLDTNFYWPASVLSGPPFIYYFVPYYFFGVWSVLAHVGIGVRYWIEESGRERAARRVEKAFILGGALVSAFILPVIAGVWFDIDLPQEWIDYLRFYVPDFVPWG